MPRSGCRSSDGTTAQASIRQYLERSGGEESDIGSGKKIGFSYPSLGMGSGVHSMTAPVGSEECRRQAAFEHAVSPESGRLYRLALAIVDDAGEAEDAVQDTMLIAWRRWSSLQGYENQSAWLTRVCIRECLRRRRLLRRMFLESPRGAPQANPPQPSYLDGQLLDLHRAYTSLSPPQRAMVTLHLHDGFTVDECAAILGCRPGTARSHLGRAVAKLRKELGHA